MLKGECHVVQARTYTTYRSAYNAEELLTSQERNRMEIVLVLNDLKKRDWNCSAQSNN